MYYNPPISKNNHNSDKQSGLLKAAWAKHASPLARWTLATLASRTDTYGVYYIKDGIPANCRKRDNTTGEPLPLTESVLVRHWQGQHTIGLYTTAPDDTALVTVLDIDNHHTKEILSNAAALANSVAMQKICEKLLKLGMQFIAYDSDGKGSYHVWIPWTERIPYATARSFGLWLTEDCKVDVEVNPKGAVSHTPKKCGNYVRLMLPKPSKTAYPVFWTGERWIWAKTPDDVDAAVKHLLSVQGNDPNKIPQPALDFVEPPRPPRTVSVSDRQGAIVVDWSDVGSTFQGDLKTLDWPGLFEEANRLGREIGEGQWEVTCPWCEEHSTGTSGTCIWKRDGEYPGFNCMHKHCQDKGRTILDALAFFGADKVDAACAGYFTDRAEWHTEIISKVYCPETVRPERPAVIKPPTVEPPAAAPNDRTAYLWKGNHANPANVDEASRKRRAASVSAAYDLIPEKGFLPDFLTTYLPTTAASPMLLIGAALSTAASVLGRSVWVRNGDTALNPALWIALIAASGEHKSTAVNKEKDVLGSGFS